MCSSDDFVAEGWHAAPAAATRVAPRPWTIGEVIEPEPPPAEATPEVVVSEAEVLEAAVAEARAVAWEEGHRAGLEEGRRTEENRTRSVREAAARAVTEVEARVVRLEEAARKELPALATAIASHLVGQAVEADPATLRRLVKQAVSEFLPDELVRVRLHPRDLALLSSPAGGESEGPGVGRAVRWISDPEVRPGGCLVESRDRLVDGRISTALERIYRALGEEEE